MGSVCSSKVNRYDDEKYPTNIDQKIPSLPSEKTPIMENPQSQKMNAIVTNEIGIEKRNLSEYEIMRMSDVDRELLRNSSADIYKLPSPQNNIIPTKWSDVNNNLPTLKEEPSTLTNPPSNKPQHNRNYSGSHSSAPPNRPVPRRSLPNRPSLDTPQPKESVSDIAKKIAQESMNLGAPKLIGRVTADSNATIATCNTLSSMGDEDDMKNTEILSTPPQTTSNPDSLNIYSSQSSSKQKRTTPQKPTTLSYLDPVNVGGDLSPFAMDDDANVNYNKRKHQDLSVTDYGLTRNLSDSTMFDEDGAKKINRIKQSMSASPFDGNQTVFGSTISFDMDADVNQSMTPFVIGKDGSEYDSFGRKVFIAKSGPPKLKTRQKPQNVNSV